MIVIYHNPRCSKSRKTLELLNDRKISPTIINYLETPISHDELSTILGLLDKQPQDIIRFNEQQAKDLNLSTSDHRSVDEWIEIMVSHPILIERPIVINGNKAVMGRPPENVLAIL